MTRRPLVVLGATGSIGRQTLEVAAANGFEVSVIAARRPGDELLQLADNHPEAQVIATGGASDERERLAEAVGDRASFGMDALVEAAATPGHIVVNGLVGATGLRPTIAALAAGNRLALANKESLVAAGPLVMDMAEKAGAELIPIDSEHSALFQLVAGADRAELQSLVLTASGGPFRGKRRSELEEVTPAEALAHPTWDMGRRISVDSATLVNKGLEVIEAHMLFGIPYDRIEVVVHPQSLVHSLIRLTDGSLLAHVGATDMRIPIAYALSYPERVPSAVEFALPGTTLQFEEVDLETFRALSLAYAAGRAGGTAPCVFNAADEVAVQGFLGGRLGFMGIPEVIEQTLEQMPAEPLESVDHVLETDAEARSLASSLVAGVC
ncbi:MAG: 1-deoxy-D-xylulose-5-phosphate reductoisomerase [Acidimicrobiia bacterium]|nr:1-deoxy-D-xylulose-5-phosphate reductoisomerase [Acidimicrobiia bacterium]